MPTSSRQQAPEPPGQHSTRASISRQPRRLKYPTQKSARSDSLKVCSNAGRSLSSMLSKIRGIVPMVSETTTSVFGHDSESSHRFHADLAAWFLPGTDELLAKGLPGAQCRHSIAWTGS